jgi:hypothetical protein
MRIFKMSINLPTAIINVGRVAVGIATRYGLDGPGIEYRWRRDFRTRPDQPWGLPSLLHNGYRVFPGGLLPIPSTAEVKERVELYLYSPYGPSWPVIGWNLPLPLLPSLSAAVAVALSRLMMSDLFQLIKKYI